MTDKIVEIKPKPKETEAEIAWMNRQALQIAAQLPEGREKALAVLALTVRLVETFLYPLS